MCEGKVRKLHMLNLGPWQLITATIFFSIFFLAFHNQYKRMWWSSVVIALLCVAGTFGVATTLEQWILFIVGSGINIVFDTVAVYRKKWRYNTHHGYVYWAGPGWGVVTVIVHQLATVASSSVLLFLISIAAAILYQRRKQEFSRHNYSWRTTWIPFAIAAVLLKPQLFLVSVSIGIILEFFAVTLFKTWEYPKPIFLHIGIGYGILMVLIDLCLRFFANGLSPTQWLYILAILGFFVFEYCLAVSKAKSVALLRFLGGRLGSNN